MLRMNKRRAETLADCLGVITSTRTAEVKVTDRPVLVGRNLPPVLTQMKISHTVEVPDDYWVVAYKVLGDLYISLIGEEETSKTVVTVILWDKSKVMAAYPKEQNVTNVVIELNKEDKLGSYLEYLDFITPHAIGVWVKESEFGADYIELDLDTLLETE